MRRCRSRPGRCRRATASRSRRRSGRSRGRRSQVKEALYRIAQEALHNTVKHARARHVEVRLQESDDGFVLEVRDDGQGFDAGTAYPGHLGLHTMQERAQGVGARLQIESDPDRGTLIRVCVPRK